MDNTFKSSAFKKRTDMHWARKLWHSLGVLCLFFVNSYFSEKNSIIIFSILFLLFVPIDIIRLYNSKVNDFALSIFKPIMRIHEVKKIAGTSYLITGVLLITYFFPKEIVSLTLLFLAFADPLASFVGIRYGKDKIFGHKSLQGFMAAFFTCAFITFVFLYFGLVPMDFWRRLLISILAGLIGALAELIPVWKLDDNFTLPVISALGLSFLFYFFGS